MPTALSRPFEKASAYRPQWSYLTTETRWVPQARSIACGSGPFRPVADEAIMLSSAITIQGMPSGPAACSPYLQHPHLCLRGAESKTFYTGPSSLLTRHDDDQRRASTAIVH